MHISELFNTQRPALTPSISVAARFKRALSIAADLLAPRVYRRLRLARRFAHFFGDTAKLQNYVPVKANLSDLHEQIDWCRTNTEECKRIAAMGQAFAMARTYETELDSGVRRLAKSFKAGMLRATIPS